MSGDLSLKQNINLVVWKAHLMLTKVDKSQTNIKDLLQLFEKYNLQMTK